MRRRGARRGVQGGNGSQPRWIVDFFTQARPGRGRFARCGPGHAATCALVRGCVPEESPACVSRRTGGLARNILLSLKPFGRVSCLPRRAAPQRQDVMRAVAATVAWRAVRDDRRDAGSGEYVGNMCAAARLALLAGLPTLGGAPRRVPGSPCSRSPYGLLRCARAGPQICPDV